MTEQRSEPLPLPDYDELPAGGVEHRIRSLTGDDVQRLLDYERAHADRPLLVDILTARLRQLDEGAEPAPGDPEGARPEKPEGRQGRSPASPDTAAEPEPPLRHGVHNVHDM
ncbi:hypothetical protein GCM10009801_66120 [Streptomyces albiaxialis]|uniref:DUF8129 domain-containing protein n=1 Tax=Streptomyces albiaxialis TaxID=329523 RepID=A0ABN2WQR4_9ACTN